MLNPAGELDRKTYIGGSDISAILGISPWKTPLDVYLDKIKGEQEIISDSRKKIFTRGKRMEPYIIDIMQEETGLEIIARNNRYKHPEYNYIAAEIDAETVSGENIEIKTVSPFKAHEWGEEQSDAIPIHYTAQAMHGLMVTGRQLCIFGVLIGGDDFRVYRVERDNETVSAILEREKQFWKLVIERSPPPVTSVKDISRLFYRDSGDNIEADGRIIGIINDLKAAKATSKELDKEIKLYEHALKLYLEDKSTITMDGKPLVTWKVQESKRLDQTLLKNTDPDLFEKFTTLSKSRVLRIK